MNLRTRCLRHVVLAAGLVASLASARSAGGSDKTVWLVGNEHGVWLVRGGNGKFEVLVKPTGKPWKWVDRNVSGGPFGGVAIGQQLHVLLSDSMSTLVYRHDPGGSQLGIGLKASHRHWRSGVVPRAVCGSSRFADSTAPTLIAVVDSSAAPKPPPSATGPASRAASGPTSRRARSRPATASAPATKKGRRHLAVFQTVDGLWQFLALREGVDLAKDDRVFATVAAGRLHTLIHRGGKEAGNELAWWHPGQEPPLDWPTIPLPAAPAAGKPLALVTCHGRPSLLYATPAKAGDRTRWEVHIASYQGAGAGKAFADQAVTDADTGKPLTWARANLPVATSMGEQFALFWQADGKPKFAPCPLSGQTKPTDLEILDRLPPDDRGVGILENFTWGLVAAIFFGLFVLRRRGPVKPFVLPPQLRPGRLHRRLLAAMIDAVPFAVLASVISFVMSDAKSVVEFEQMMKPINAQERVPAHFAYAGIVTAVAYTVYGCLMEWRFGATLGKMLLGLRVVANEGMRASPRGIILRNLLKMLEVRWTLLLLVPLLNRFRLRLGDWVARTIVVELNPHAPPPGQEQPPVGHDENTHPPSDPPS